jgi:hypothetical protein
MLNQQSTLANNNKKTYSELALSFWINLTKPGYRSNEQSFVTTTLGFTNQWWLKHACKTMFIFSKHL